MQIDEQKIAAMIKNHISSLLMEKTAAMPGQAPAESAKSFPTEKEEPIKSMQTFYGDNNLDTLVMHTQVTQIN